MSRVHAADGITPMNPRAELIFG